jgi:hypothetical protein
LNWILLIVTLASLALWLRERRRSEALDRQLTAALRRGVEKARKPGRRSFMARARAEIDELIAAAQGGWL